MDIRKVRPGEDLVFPAAAYNAFVDAANLTKQFGSPDPSQRVRPLSNGLVVRVSNRNSAFQKRFATMQIMGPVFEPDAASETQRQQFYGETGLAADVTDGSYGEWGILLQGLENKQAGLLQVTGTVNCKIKLRDKRHTNVTYSTEDGEDYAVSCDGGDGQILWVKGGDDGSNGVGNAAATGEQDAVILLTGEPAQVWAKLGDPDAETKQRFAWAQQSRWFDTDQWFYEATPTGLSGTAESKPAVERYGRPVGAKGQYVLLTRGWRADNSTAASSGGGGPTLEPVWFYDGGNDVTVKIDSPCTGGGKYLGHIITQMNEDMGIDTDVDLFALDIGAPSTPTGTQVIIMNTLELGTDHNDLDSGSYHVGRIVGRNTFEPGSGAEAGTGGEWVVEITSVSVGDCDLGSSGA